MRHASESLSLSEIPKPNTEKLSTYSESAVLKSYIFDILLTHYLYNYCIIKTSVCNYSKYTSVKRETDEKFRFNIHQRLAGR